MENSRGEARGIPKSSHSPSKVKVCNFLIKKFFLYALYNNYNIVHG